MSLKENLKAVKNSLSSEEQMIESFIKSERFIKKNKFIFLVIAVLLVAYLVYYYASDMIVSKRVQQNNEIYLALLQNPNDNDKLAQLKDKNPNLYVLFLLSRDVNDGAIKEAQNLKLEPLLKEILNANTPTNSHSQFLNDYHKILNAYELLQQDKIEEANLILSQIPMNSELQNLVSNFRHYKGIK